MSKPSNNSRRQSILKMYEDGVGLKEIAAAFGYSTHGYVSRIVREARRDGDLRAKPRRPGPRPGARPSPAAAAVAKGRAIIDQNGGLGRGISLTVNGVVVARGS